MTYYKDFFSGWATPPNGGAKYRIRLRVAVKAQSQSLNRSTLEYDLFLEKDRAYQGFYDYSTSWSIQLNGATVKSGSGQNPTEPWVGTAAHLIDSGTLNVTHGANGTKNIAVDATFTGPNSGWAIGSVSIPNGQTMDLPDIERGTVPVVSPSPAIVGETVEIALDRAESSYTHDLTWESGELLGTIGTGVGESATWTVPDVMDEFPGKIIAPITITAVTKNGSTIVGTQQATLFVKSSSSFATGESFGPDEQMDIRATLVEWIDGEWVRTERLGGLVSLVDPHSATATCVVTLSKLSQSIPDYSVVDIEVYNGSGWVYTDHRFVLTRIEGDQAEPSQTFSYSGTEFVDFLLGRAFTQKDYKWDGPKYIAATKKQPTPTRARTSPGDILRVLINDAKARDWGVRLVVDFSAAKTSLGDKWANSAVELDVSKGTRLLQVLEGFVSDGYVEYRTRYDGNSAYLTLMNPGTGSDFSALGSDPVVNLSTVPAQRAPLRATAEGRISRVTVAGQDTLQVTEERAAWDDDVFGQLEGWVAASGVGKAATASKIAKRALSDNFSPSAERTFSYKAASVQPHAMPYYVYRPGDWILVPSQGGNNAVRDRIASVSIDKTDDGTTLTVVMGDRIMSGVASIRKRQDAQTGGSVPGGTQVSVSTLDSRIPDGPEILTTVSEGYWDTDGAGRSNITIEWAPVIAAISGSPVDVSFYEVWGRPAASGREFSYLTSISADDVLSATVGGYDPGVDIELRIRALSAEGVYGEFSENVVVTTVAPSVDLDGPDLADLYADGLGTVYAVWGGNIGGSLAPSRLAYVAAEVSTDGGTTFTTTGTPIVAAGTIVIRPDGYGTFTVRLRGYDRLGNPGEASTTLAVTTTDPRINPPAPLAPTGLSAVAGAGWDASGVSPVAWFDLEWTAPTLDVNGDAVSIVGYDVWGSRTDETEVRYLTSVSETSARWYVGDGEEWSFEVRASSGYGAVSVPSAPVVATANASVSAPPTPATPSLDQYAGILRVAWSGVGMEPQVKYAYVTISADNVTYTRAGMPLIGAGEASIPGLAPGAYYAKIVTVDERGQTATSAAAGPITLLPITGVTYQTSPLAGTGIKINSGGMTAYDDAGAPTFILDATTGQVWIAPYEAVFEFGAGGKTVTGVTVTGLAISAEDSSFNTFIHPSGLQIRNDQTILSSWEADATDANLVNFVSPRANITKRIGLPGVFEGVEEAVGTGTRLVFRYRGA